MKIEFVIRDWAAWAPTLDQRSQWLAWAGDAAAACPPVSGEAPPLAAMPAMSRRRLTPLGRMAAQVSYDTAGPSSGDDDAGAPLIFASRYGDAARSLALLADLTRREPISPTAFGLSVHNAIGAMVSIARADRADHTALAGGASSAGAALIEAAGLLADQPLGGEAVIVHYDAPLPGGYAAFADEPQAAYAWAWRVARPAAGEARLRLVLEPAADPRPDQDTVPFGLGLLRFWLSGQPRWVRRVDGQCWHFSRSASEAAHG